MVVINENKIIEIIIDDLIEKTEEPIQFWKNIKKQLVELKGSLDKKSFSEALLELNKIGNLE
jgi:hypothetical protein